MSGNMVTNILTAILYMEILMFFLTCIVIAIGFFDVLKQH